MVGNPPTPEDLKRNVKATLIVVPAAVLDQWMDEIEFHTEQKVFKKVQRYKTSAQISEAVLQDMDIVVTTYNEVMRQFPYPDKKERLAIETIGYQQWWKQALENVGDLHRVNWYRIVLDEAHAIKNNAARTSLACQNLKSVYRWCLTGTPLLNRLEE
jgi:SNF2 family DNA or RNA helicase